MPKAVLQDLQWSSVYCLNRLSINVFNNNGSQYKPSVENSKIWVQLLGKREFH